MLGQRALDQFGNIVVGVSHRRKAIGHIQVSHEVDDAAGQDLPHLILGNTGNICSKGFGGSQMTPRIGLGGETKDGGRIQYDRHAVGNDGVIRGVALRKKARALLETG